MQTNFPIQLRLRCLPPSYRLRCLPPTKKLDLQKQTNRTNEIRKRVVVEFEQYKKGLLKYLKMML